jgi:DNA (cytosine-5)-methyltransferase 1
LEAGSLTSLELCAGGGGQAIGVEQAGFSHIALVDNDKFAVATLRRNRPGWIVYEDDLRHFARVRAKDYIGQVDLVAGGVPCPPFSIAGKQLGHEDDRDLFPTALKIVRAVKPRAVMLENVKGLLDPRFAEYRKRIDEAFERMGYRSDWRLLQAADYGVSQLRPRVVCVAMKKPLMKLFKWPEPRTPGCSAPPVGSVLGALMGENGWTGTEAWSKRAHRIAPTLVGGSKKHGGPDLGPTRARAAWAQLGVDGLGIAESAPAHEFSGDPKITVRMAALLQGFPDDWEFAGGKTAAYRQVGNAFPPPVARAVAEQIRAALEAH